MVFLLYLEGLFGCLPKPFPQGVSSPLMPSETVEMGLFKKRYLLIFGAAGR